jgi:hypothetical protein
MTARNHTQNYTNLTDATSATDISTSVNHAMAGAQALGDGLLQTA